MAGTEGLSCKGKAGTVVFSPHIHNGSSIERIMWDVVIALIPAGLASVYFFGMNSIRIIGISLLTGITTELLMCLITRRPVTILDGSAVITSLLFAYIMPPSCPWYVIIAGCSFSIAVVKWAFGGLGNNFMNPALGGYIFSAAAWQNIVTGSWSPTIRPFLKAGFGFFDASLQIIDPVIINGRATPLSALKTGGWDAVTSAHLDNYFNLFIGNIPGAIGETSKLAILIGLGYLLIRRIILPVIPLVFMGSSIVFLSVFGGFQFPLFHLLSGGLILCASFMAVDYTTSPITVAGKIIFAVSLGLLTAVIRLWGDFAEGALYAVAFMNIFVPLIDRFVRKRIFGYGRSG